MPIHLPPLRERKSDLRLLFDIFLTRESVRQGVQITAVEPAVYEAIAAYPWPGNIRELANVCIYVAAVVSANANAVTLECLPINFMKSLDSESRNAGANPGSAADSTQPGKANPDSAAIAASLRAADGNKSEAARMLGISRMTLWRKIREMG